MKNYVEKMRAYEAAKEANQKPEVKVTFRNLTLFLPTNHLEFSDDSSAPDRNFYESINYT